MLQNKGRRSYADSGLKDVTHDPWHSKHKAGFCPYLQKFSRYYSNRRMAVKPRVLIGPAGEFQWRPSRLYRWHTGPVSQSDLANVGEEVQCLS